MILDLSDAIHVEDMRPNRSAVLLPLMIKFVREFFNQNPLSQLGLIACKDGKAGTDTNCPDLRRRTKANNMLVSDGVGGVFRYKTG